MDRAVKMNKVHPIQYGCVGLVGMSRQTIPCFGRATADRNCGVIF